TLAMSSAIAARSAGSPRSSAVTAAIAATTDGGGGASPASGTARRSRPAVASGVASGSCSVTIPAGPQAMPQGPMAVSKSVKPNAVIRAPSEMPGLGRHLPPRIVAAVGVADRRFDQLLRRNVVERVHRHRDEVAADLLDIALGEGTDAAMAAEHVVGGVGPEFVGAERILAGEEAERIGLQRHAPVA